MLKRAQTAITTWILTVIQALQTTNAAMTMTEGDLFIVKSQIRPVFVTLVWQSNNLAQVSFGNCLIYEQQYLVLRDKYTCKALTGRDSHDSHMTTQSSR